MTRARAMTAAITLAAIATLAGSVLEATAQTCTTQAKMADDVRSSLADQALAIALDIKANNGAKVQGESAPALTGNFAPTAFLLRTTSERIAADSLAVSQLYLLDASKVSGTAEVDFSCPLTATTSETDFTFGTLPAGTYAFAMVEATGPRPWLLSLLLQQDGSAWKLAGLYTHARMVGGRDGLSYWTAAREAAKAKQSWRAWLLYAEADALLAPAPFIDSTHLDKLRSEQREALPPELGDGLNAQTPLVLKDAKGESIAYTAVAPDSSDDGSKLRLAVHYRATPLADPAAAGARNLDAARTLLDAHKDLRTGVDSVFVFADLEGQAPFATEIPMSQIP
ncbi:hypothetical protein [Bryocella elongata]|nr:hypothetical protein [Bryocella elongata]